MGGSAPVSVLLRQGYGGHSNSLGQKASAQGRCRPPCLSALARFSQRLLCSANCSRAGHIPGVLDRVTHIQWCIIKTDLAKEMPGGGSDFERLSVTLLGIALTGAEHPGFSVAAA